MTTSLEFQHFAILEITQAPTPSGIIITCRTNNPCHLTIYFTDKPPVRHATSRVVRGLALPWGAYWCFVAWNSLQQQEAGDTLIHTFEVSPWAYCQTKWFSFRGIIAGELSPSAGPLIKKHYAFKIYEQLVGAIDGSYPFYGPEYRHAQTFPPQESHRIVGVYLRLWHKESPGIVTASITHTDAVGKPIPPYITAGTIDGNTLPSTHPGEWVYIPLTPRNLTKSTEYAIVLQAQARIIYWVAGPYWGYPRGHHWISDDYGNTWWQNPWHLFFQDWGTPL
ncbi:hypothetical protein ES708_33317 [subsurface metagenome]